MSTASRREAGLSGRTALVTGAAQGIGAACARRLAEDGANVIVADIDLTGANRVASQIGACARAIRLDVASGSDWEAAVAFAEAAFSPLSILVNNAAIARYGNLETTDEATFRELMEVNLLSVFLGMKHAAPSLRRAGGGSIINIGAITAIRPPSGLIGYVACKWGLRGLTRSAAQELGPDWIRVNAVHPGMIETPMTAGMPAPAGIPLPRKGSAEEVADLVHYLASDAASYITGTDVVIDGGKLATA